jgi:hypothetical protein
MRRRCWISEFVCSVVFAPIMAYMYGMYNPRWWLSTKHNKENLA